MVFVCLGIAKKIFYVRFQQKFLLNLNIKKKKMISFELLFRNVK